MGHGTRFGGRLANTVNELQTRFVAVVGNVVVVIENVTRASGLQVSRRCDCNFSKFSLRARSGRRIAGWSWSGLGAMRVASGAFCT